MTQDQAEKKVLEKQKRKAYREYLSDLRQDRRTIGVKFYDAKGSGRIINGKKKYDWYITKFDKSIFYYCFINYLVDYF